jgi:hypothetical protein
VVGGGYVALRLLDKFAGINKGTPYEGSGVVGTAANLANQASGGALAATGSWIGRTLYDFVNPSSPRGQVFYTFTLPDGSRGSVDSADVRNGLFVRRGARYRLKVDVSGRKYAVPA